MTGLRKNLADHIVFMFVFALTFPVRASENDSSGQVPEELRSRAVDVLQHTLEHESRWVKLHAAEFLLALDHPQCVAKVFAKELDESGDVAGYRVGIWRVLARAAVQKKQRGEWTAKIRDVFLDPEAPDRLHAAEALGKLGYTIRKQGDGLFDRVSQSNEGQLSVNARWVLANSGQEKAITKLGELLTSDRAIVRGDAAYALRFLPLLPPAVCEKLVTAAENEPSDSAARIYLLSAAAVHVKNERKKSLKGQLLAYAAKGIGSEKFEVCMALAHLGTNDDLPLLMRLMQDKSADVRCGAAYAILRL